jgi:asparagine synthase (glutamine-hydrolysing)
MADQLPKNIVSKKKWGFTVNPYLQFKKDLRDAAKNILTKNYIEEQGIFNFEYIKRIIDYPPNPKLRWHYNYLWIVVGFAIWEKMFIRTDDFLKKEFNIEEYFN